MKQDWTKITEKRGDDGKTDLLFKHEVDKIHAVIRLLNTLEMAHASIATVSSVVRNKKPPLHSEAHIKESMVLIDDAFIRIMGSIAGYKDPEKYKEKFADIEDEFLEYLDDEVVFVGDELNHSTAEIGWVSYSKITTPLAAALSTMTTLVRRAELDVLSLMFNYGLDKRIAQILNRLSKVTFLYTVWAEATA